MLLAKLSQVFVIVQIPWYFAYADTAHQRQAQAWAAAWAVPVQLCLLMSLDSAPALSPSTAQKGEAGHLDRPQTSLGISNREENCLDTPAHTLKTWAPTNSRKLRI